MSKEGHQQAVMQKASVTSRTGGDGRLDVAGSDTAGPELMGTYTRWLLLPALLIGFMITTSGCDRLSIKESLNGFEAELTNHHGETVTFPGSFEGKVVLIGYLYTHCPDICPIITYNMREIDRELSNPDVHFIGITLDPPRDDPEVLADYARRFQLDEDRWSLLTGSREEVGKVLEKLDIIARRTPIRELDSGTQVYFIDHTDRVSLMDGEANLRRHYLGSELNGEEVQSDIRTLLDRFH